MTTWTERLWAEIEPTYAAILDHPFLRGLADGTLPEAAFRHYLAQDALYLRDYARALAVVGARASEPGHGAMFARHAAQTAEVELALHEALLPELGVELAGVSAGPTTTAYTSYLLAAVFGGSYAEGVAAVLPCYWIYQRVGAKLLGRGSPNRSYQRWIDTYAGDEFAQTVAEVLAAADQLGATLAVEDERRARERFVVTSRYEWLFWDAGWRQERWPV